MSEADGKVRIEYEIDGVEEASAAQQELEASLRDVQQVLDNGAATLAEYEQAQTNAADAADTLTAAAVDGGFKLAEMRERVNSATAALGSLASMLGTDSEAGAVVGRLNHFSQLGAQVGGVFGPEGAVVGAIGGATVGALVSLYDALEPVLPAIESVGAAAIVAASDIDQMGASAQSAGDRMRSFVDSMSLTNQARGLADINAQITETSDRIAALRDSGSAFDRLEIPQLTAQLSELMQRSGEAASEVEANTSARRRGGGGRSSRSVDARAEERFLSEFRVGLMDEEEQRELERIRRVDEAERRMLDERKEREEALARDRDEWERESLANRVREESEALEQQEQKRTQIKRRQEADARMWRGTQESMLDATLGGANAIGGAFANAFGAAIQGQEDFGVAFVKGMKMQLIQYGVGQVAEGTGALLSAVGLAFTNPPAAAGKAVEGAGKIALGVSLGAAGAAISTPAAGGTSEDRAPRLGPAANDQSSGASIVVNMNSPFVTAGTRAELGRSMSRTIGDSARRFGRAA